MTSVPPASPANRPPGFAGRTSLLPLWTRNLAPVALVALLFPLNLLLSEFLDDYYYLILIQIGLNIILATSLNLINGVAGQFSLGHAGFMAIGAYTTGVLLLHFAPGHDDQAAFIPLFLGVVILGGLLAGLAAMLIGLPVLRLRGDYLAIATLAFGEIIYTVLINIEHIGPLKVGGASGLSGIPHFTNVFWTYAAAVTCVVCVWRLVYSTKGKAFVAIREDEVAAAAMGIDTTYYKVAAFVIGAFFAGVAGGLSVTLVQSIDPAAYRFTRSIEMVVMVVLGGSGSITGVVIAAVVLTYLPEGLRPVRQWTGEDLRMPIYAMLLIVMMLVRPQGFLGRRELWWTRRRPGPTQAAGDPTAQPR